jgi:hypothetical protein
MVEGFMPAGFLWAADALVTLGCLEYLYASCLSDGSVSSRVRRFEKLGYLIKMGRADGYRIAWLAPNPRQGPGGVLLAATRDQGVKFHFGAFAF